MLPRKLGRPAQNDFEEPRTGGAPLALLRGAMERHARGERDAFTLIHDVLKPRLRRILLRRGCSGELADDILQQTFLRLHAARGDYRSGRELMPWASTIAVRLVVDAWRKAALESLALPSVSEASDGSPEEQLIASELSRTLRESLARLPHAQREAFELVKLRGFSLGEAAELLNTSKLAIKLRVHRAAEALRDAVAPQHDL